jgi:hypothetical protein
VKVKSKEKKEKKPKNHLQKLYPISLKVQNLLNVRKEENANQKERK